MTARGWAAVTWGEPWRTVTRKEMSEAFAEALCGMPQELSAATDADKRAAHQAICKVADKHGRKRRLLYGVLRITLTGKPDGLDAVEVMCILGRGRVFSRVQQAWEMNRGDQPAETCEKEESQ